MPIETISLTEDQSRFIASQIEAGNYRDAEEVVHAGLQALDEREYQRKLAILRAAIDEGEAGGVVEGDVFERVFESIRLRAASRAEATLVKS